MSWWNPWRKTQVELSLAKQRRVANLTPGKAIDQTPLKQQRWVIVDLEASGLNTLKDCILSIGAVAIEQGGIPLGKQFACTLQRAEQQVTESVLIHQLAPSKLAKGIAPATAVLRFLEFVGDSPILAFHADFDQRLLVREAKQLLNYKLEHVFYDLALLAPALSPQLEANSCSLDQCLSHFKLNILQRHNASADALATAELSLILLHLAEQQGIHTLADWDRLYRGLKQRQQQHFSF